MRFLAQAVATGLFVGYVPLAPGTAGSLLGALLYHLVPGSETWVLAPVVLALFGLGVWAAHRTEKETGERDNPIIVIDEIVGVLVTLAFIEKRVIWLAIGFLLFRLFDILKPPPVRQAERISGGWGVMLDDVVAGVYGALSLQALHFMVTSLV